MSRVYQPGKANCVNKSIIKLALNLAVKEKQQTPRSTAHPARGPGKERAKRRRPGCPSPTQHVDLSRPPQALREKGNGSLATCAGLCPTSWVSRRVKKGFRYLASSHRKPLRSCRLM